MGVVTGARRVSARKAGYDVMTWLTDVREATDGNKNLDPFSEYDKFEDVDPSNQSAWLVASGLSPTLLS